MRRYVKTIHKDQKDFIRRDCGKSFTQARYLRLHIKTLHEGHKEFKYDSCEESFTILPNLRGSCEKSFNGATSLRIHIKQFMKITYSATSQFTFFGARNFS